MAPQQLHVLFEHASGYALFRVNEMEEVGMLLPQVEAGVNDLSKFSAIVKLVAFSAFKSGTNALDNMNSISEGVVHDDLRTFLDTNVPKSSKKRKSILGIGDSKIAASLSEDTGFSCQHTDIVPEIIRGIRVHFSKMVKGLTDRTSGKAQLGLGHSYSRAKVKFNVNRVDNMIIQSISLLDMLDKDINTFTMRVREWYSYHFPELARIVTDNYLYVRVTQIVGNRKQMDDAEVLSAIEEIIMDTAKAQSVIDATKSSMGMDISPIDLINIERFCKRVISLADYRKSLFTYLKSKMHQVSPNLTTLIGEQVGARLISHAGSLTNLAKCPASTVQILGAEKALFRALKTKGNTPKYGLIYHSTFIGRAGTKNKGRISRYLANKCSIASRIDCFSDNPSTVYGEHLREQVEERLKFYEVGEAPRKNLVVMKIAHDEAALFEAAAAKKDKKKKKKKRKSEVLENGDDSVAMDTSGVVDSDEPVSKKSKKKKRKSEVSENDISMDIDEQTPSKKSKKKKRKSEG